ncbi:MAG: DUF362 domain-containing protein [Eubacteriaceae bacterium]
MSSEVFFTDIKDIGRGDNLLLRLDNLINKSNICKVVKSKDLTAIKLHFGEPGNTTFVSPVFVRKVVDKIKEAQGNPYLTDTNTLYFGKRDNSVNHLNSAIKNGFAYAVVDAPIIIADGIRGKNTQSITINKKHFKEVLIAGDINNSDSMIVLSHFKGHELAGFGGAIKNLAMGCASAAGKQKQHSTMKPEVGSFCIKCGKCIKWCPEGAIQLHEKKAKISKKVCVGCGECIAMCPVNAIKPQWKTNYKEFHERMVEYAYGAVKEKMQDQKVAFINFVINVTPHCDCKSWSNRAIVPDVGILASFDPVALDKASFDLVNDERGINETMLSCNHEQGEDKFFAIENRQIDSNHQLNYADEVGLGSQDYELIRVK